LNVTVYNSSDEMTTPDKITAVNSNTMTIEFNVATSGYVSLCVDTVRTEAVALSTWVITHRLSGEYLNVTVYDVNDEVVTPDSTVVSGGTVSITFNTPTIGVAVLGTTNSTESFAISNTTYTNSYTFDPSVTTFLTTKRRAKLNTSIVQGKVYPVINLDDTSDIPNARGYLVFSFGRGDQEVPVPYVGRPSNNSLLLDPTYVFEKTHDVGTIVNYVSQIVPYDPRDNGQDYAVYITGAERALQEVEEILQQIKTLGTVIRFEIQRPVYRFISLHELLPET
jgi:hypothetical protein